MLLNFRKNRGLGSDLEGDDELRDFRKSRFRILVCVDGSDESYRGVSIASKLGKSNDVDIVLLYVRPIDQGLRSGRVGRRSHPPQRVVREVDVHPGLLQRHAALAIVFGLAT